MNEKRKVIKTDIVEHRGEKRIRLLFDYDEELISLVKQIPGRKWSQTMRCWHVPINSSYHKILNNNNIEIIELTNEHPHNFKIKKGDTYLKANIDKSGKYQDFIKNEITLYIAYHESLIYIKMPYHKKWILHIKKMEGWWHDQSKLWSIYYSEEYLNMIEDYFNQEGCKVKIREKEIDHKTKKREFKKRVTRDILPREYLVQLKLENKSERTIEVYSGFVAQFLDHFKDKDIATLEIEEIREYILSNREEKGYSESYQNQMISSIRSYYRKIHGRELGNDTLPRPHRGRQLPKVLPREDIQRMISMCKNRKHRMILFLLYGFGLRVSEVIILRTVNIDFEKKRLYIIKGKGKKDRVLPIPDILLNEMKEYRRQYMPEEYFIGGTFGNSYASTSVQRMVKELAIKSGIKKTVTPHILRHCYATHMLEKGIDLRYIQVLLGHKSSKTTEIYTHVSVNKLVELSNPMDDIKF